MSWWFQPLAGAQLLQPAAGVSGTGASTLAGVSQTASGTVLCKGNGAATLDGVTQAAQGAVAVKGSGTASLDGISQTAAGTVGTPAGVNGNGAATLAGVTQTAQGAVLAKGTGTATLAGIAQTAQGTVLVKGTGATTLAGVTQAAQGAVLSKGAGAASLAGVTQAAQGAVLVTGTGGATLAGVEQSATGQVGIGAINGAGSASLEGVAQTASGRVAISGAGFALLEGVAQLGAGSVIIPAIPPYDWAPPVDLATSAIIGQALRHIRQAPVARLDPEAEILPALAAGFDRAIDECLDGSDWSFASTLAVLAGAALPPGAVLDDTLPYSYQLPGDLVRIRRVGNRSTRWRVDAGVLRASDPAPLTIRYTARVTRESALPATFQAAVSLQIASLLGARWAGSVIEGDDIAMRALETLKQAMREDSRHAAAERAMDGPGLSYTAFDDWAMEATS